MSGLLQYLVSEDFVLQQGEKGLLLCNRIPGFSFVLFYVASDAHSAKAFQVIKALPGTINGCQFAVVDLLHPRGRNVLAMSKQTVMEILYVPQMILFVNGRPWLVYQEVPDVQKIQQFIMTAVNLTAKRRSMETPTHEETKQAMKHIPASLIGIGVPIKGFGRYEDSISYIDWNTFERATQPGNQQGFHRV